MEDVGLILRKELSAVHKAAAIISLAAYVLIETVTPRAAAGDVETDVSVANDPTAVQQSAEWPQWCGRQDRNMVSGATGLPDGFDQVCGPKPDVGRLRNVKWAARLGEAVYGSPVVAGGRVYIGGCESGMGRDDAIGVLWCFRQSDGGLLWRLRSPYIAGLYNRSFGITSTPTVEGDRVYLLGHLGEVLSLNVNGLAKGNSGPFQDEEALLALGREKLKEELAPDGNRILEYSHGTPGKLDFTDADIVWRFDMIKEVRCWPFNAQNAALLIRGDRLYVPTCSVFDRRPGEGPTVVPPEEWKKKYHRKTYDSPNIIVLDKHTGTGDITPTGKVWSLDTIRSSSSTVAIADGLLYTADASGMVYCLDADTGRVYWTHQTSPGWASPLVADGKVFLPTYNAGLLVMATGKQRRIISQSPSQSHMVSSPAVANGVVYVANQKYLYALQRRPTGAKTEHAASPVHQ